MLAFLTIIPWILTQDPILTVVLATAVDMLGALPTIRKTWRSPTSESQLSWIFTILKHVSSLLAIASLSITTVIFPACLLLQGSVVLGATLFSPHRKRRHFK